MSLTRSGRRHHGHVWTLATVPQCYSLYGRPTSLPPGLGMFTSAPLTSTHRQFWVYLNFKRLLLKGLQCYRQHRATRSGRRLGARFSVAGANSRLKPLFLLNIYLTRSKCMCDSAVSVLRSELPTGAINRWSWGTARCRLQVPSERLRVGSQINESVKQCHQLSPAIRISF